MSELKIRNKRLKISPGGVVTMPVSARRALGMSKGEGIRVGVSVKDASVVLTARVKPGKPTYRVSSAGQLLLKGDAKDMLLSGDNRHFWLELNDQKQQATLHPCK